MDRPLRFLRDVGGRVRERRRRRPYVGVGGDDGAEGRVLPRRLPAPESNPGPDERSEAANDPPLLAGDPGGSHGERRGFAPHAVATLLASVSKRSKKRDGRSTRGTNESRRTLEKGADDAGADGDPRRKGGIKGINARKNGFDDADAEAGLPPRVAPIPASSADRVGRSVGRVWEVSSSADSDASSRTVACPHHRTDAAAARRRSRKDGAGVGVSHDAWIERMRRARWVGRRGESAPGGSTPSAAPHESAPSQRGSDAENEAPWWARAESTAGVGATSPFLDATTAFFDV